MVYACHNCRTRGTDKCLVCKKIDQDDYRIAHAPHGAEDVAAVMPPSVMQPAHAVACVKVRSASDKTNEALLRLVHEFAQTPLPVVIALHGLLNRKTLVDVAAEQGMTKQAMNGALRRAEKRVKWLGRFRATLRRPSTGL